MSLNWTYASVDEYLNSSYRPDMEYVDGMLVERGTPTIAHSLLQLILLRYFESSERDFRFMPLPEVRTQIIERARYRIPDVMLCPLPLPQGKIVDSVPWVVIEIMSPDDRFTELQERFRDYKRIGVLHIVMLDPENLIAFRFEDGSLIKTSFTTLELPSGSVPFDSDALFEQLVAKRSEGRL